MRHRRRWIGTCGAILCLITGCGASQTEAFTVRYGAARASVHRIFVDVANTLTEAKGKTTAQIADSFGVLADRLDEQLPPLEALRPPARAANAFATLTTRLNRVEHDLRGASIAVKRRDVVAAERALHSLQGDAVAASDAAVTISHKLDHR